MADITITEEQLNIIIDISKDVQERVKANGMPELDQDLAEMITLLEQIKVPQLPEEDEEEDELEVQQAEERRQAAARIKPKKR